MSAPLAGTPEIFAVGQRERLGKGQLDDFKVLFRQVLKVTGENHFGGRIVFSPAGELFLTSGERFKFSSAQNLSGHLGTVVRLNPDGSVPEGNPFVDRAGARPEIWSYSPTTSRRRPIRTRASCGLPRWDR